MLYIAFVSIFLSIFLFTYTIKIIFPKKNYLNKIRSHLVTIVLMAPFTQKSTSKLRSALHFRYSIVTPRFIPRANTAQSY